MKKQLVIFLLLLTIISIVFATDAFPGCEKVHCWFVEATPGNSYLPTMYPTGCYISTNIYSNGVNYSSFGTPGVQVHTQGFGAYNFRCDDGASTNPNASTIYAKITIDNNNTQNIIYNSTNANGVAGDSGQSACIIQANGCPTKGNAKLGVGTMASLSTELTGVGGNIYKLFLAPYALAYTNGPFNSDPSRNGNVYIGFPSLIVSGPGDKNAGFFEAFGTTEQEVVFTIFNKSPLDANLKNYEIRSSGSGVHVSIDKSYIGYILPKFNGKMIIRGSVIIDKNTLPNNVNVWLDLNYANYDLSNGDCAQYVQSSTSSKPVTYKFGLLDEQEFQVGLKANQDAKGCIGEDGIVGVTGSAYAPRINVGFGGTTINDFKISTDECDTKLLGTPTDNPNWVYCNQKELLVELAQKINGMWNIEIQKIDTTDATTRAALDANKQKFNSSTIGGSNGNKTSIRKQTLDSTNITRSINSLSINLSDLSGTTIPNTSGNINYGTSPTEKVTALQQLFSNVNFTVNGGAYTGVLDAGSYPVTVNVEIVGNPSQRTLFVASGSSYVLNPAARISIDFSKSGATYPALNWFFYDYGYDDFNTSNLNTQNDAGFDVTNDLARGTILKTTQADNINFNSDNLFYPTKVNTIIARLKSNSQGLTDNNFTIINLANYNNDLFSYWTGIATSIGNGCVNIDDNGDSTLPFRSPDTNIFTTSGQKSFIFQDYTTAKASQTIYLQSLLFWPYNSSTTKNIVAPFGAIIDGVWYDGNKTVLLNRSISNASDYNISTIEELFNGIKSSNVCVNKTINPNRTISWNLFWNQDKIMTDINSQVRTIIRNNNDANICETRAILGS